MSTRSAKCIFLFGELAKRKRARLQSPLTHSGWRRCYHNIVFPSSKTTRCHHHHQFCIYLSSFAIVSKGSKRHKEACFVFWLRCLGSLSCEHLVIEAFGLPVWAINVKSNWIWLTELLPTAAMTRNQTFFYSGHKSKVPTNALHLPYCLPDHHHHHFSQYIVFWYVSQACWLDTELGFKENPC